MRQLDSDTKGRWVVQMSGFVPAGSGVVLPNLLCDLMCCALRCSWELHQQDGRWVMRLSAIRDIAEGEELLLSYGERSNDHFFLYYGFVPPKNPHDEVVLFGDLEEALEWHHENFQGHHLVGSRTGTWHLSLASGDARQARVQLEGPSGTNEPPGAAPGALGLRCCKGNWFCKVLLSCM